ncbi:MAG: hypothetical protein ACPG19_00595 [Saprospiraceae bacterium]
MKKGIYIIAFCLLTTLSFSQIDSSAWEGKTVLMLVDNDLYTSNLPFYNTLKTNLKEDWYLTDSNHLIIDTLSNRNLNSFGGDTVVIIWKIDWQKFYTQTGCCFSLNPDDCMIWGMAQIFEFKNFQTQKWETFVTFNFNTKLTYIQKFQQLITETSYQPSCEGKKVIVKNQRWSKELEALIKKRFKDFEIIIDFEVQNDDYPSDDGIYIFKRHNSNTIEIVDLKTHRVIEKIKIR